MSKPEAKITEITDEEAEELQYQIDKVLKYFQNFYVVFMRKIFYLKITTLTFRM